MKKPTVSDIREAGILGAYFFSKDTMRFFGQTMRSFKTEWNDKEKAIVRLFAPSFQDGKLMGTTERLIDVSTVYWKEVR
tara:strand:- start:371 stop:607 length:237 start_codon:yes stop_codon:yes gene_type:complete